MKIQFFNNFPNKSGYNCHFIPIFCFGYNNVKIKTIKLEFYHLQIGWLFWFVNITKNIKND